MTGILRRLVRPPHPEPLARDALAVAAKAQTAIEGARRVAHDYWRHPAPHVPLDDELAALEPHVLPDK